MASSQELTELMDTVEGLDLPVDGDVLVQFFGVIDRMQATASALISDFDSAELWDLEGATSMTSWLRAQAGLERRRHSHPG